MNCLVISLFMKTKSANQIWQEFHNVLCCVGALPPARCRGFHLLWSSSPVGHPQAGFPDATSLWGRDCHASGHDSLSLTPLCGTLSFWHRLIGDCWPCITTSAQPWQRGLVFEEKSSETLRLGVKRVHSPVVVIRRKWKKWWGL